MTTLGRVLAEAAEARERVGCSLETSEYLISVCVRACVRVCVCVCVRAAHFQAALLYFQANAQRPRRQENLQQPATCCGAVSSNSSAGRHWAGPAAVLMGSQTGFKCPTERNPPRYNSTAASSRHNVLYFAKRLPLFSLLKEARGPYGPTPPIPPTLHLTPIPPPPNATVIKCCH